MAGLFNNHYPIMQNNYQTYNPTQYQAQNYNTPITPSFNVQPMGLTYATEEEVRGTRLPYNSQFVAFDREKPIFYIKTTDNMGGSVTEKFNYSKVEEKSPSAENKSEFITKDELGNLVTKDDLKDIVKRDDIKDFISRKDLAEFEAKYSGLNNLLKGVEHGKKDDIRSSETI